MLNRKKFVLKQVALKMSRHFRQNVSTDYYRSEVYTNEHDYILGTLIKKVSFLTLESFLNEMGIDANRFTIKEKRVLAVFLRKLIDRYHMFDVYMDNLGQPNNFCNTVSVDYRTGNETELLRSFLEEAYARKAMNRLFYYCWYKARECYKDYENYQIHPSRKPKVSDDS